MKNQVGVWIDHRKAVIVVAGEHTPTVLESDVSGRTRFAHGGGHPAGNSSLGGRSERRQEERHRNELDEYYDEVIVALGQPDEVLIFGPGEAKLELAARMERRTVRPQPTITLDTTDKLTDPQIVEKVSKHFTVR